MMRVVITAAAVLLAVGLIWWISMREPDLRSETATGPGMGTAGEPVLQPAIVQQGGRVAPPSAPAAVVQGEPQPASPEPASPQPTAAGEPVLEAPRREGPVDEMKQRFASDPRDSAAAELETKVQTVFREMRTPPDMLKAVLCRESLCRLELRWRPERSTDYMTVMTRLSVEFDPKMAVNPGERTPDGALGLEVYWQRKPAQ
jgi:hypothetical protein